MRSPRREPTHARRAGALAAVAAALVPGCGDNATRCGAGTVEVAGECVVGEPAPPACGPGTLLDEATGACVIDPAACTDGTVLVGDQCREPSEDLVVDALEGAEPNGLGQGGEASLVPAGLIALRAVGAMPVLVKGTLAPQADRTGDGAPEPDYDTYVVEVSAPTLLEVSVDGTHGLAGGLRVTAEDAALAGWRRDALSLAGDIAQRQVVLPVAGRYHLTVADTRSLLVGAAVGDAAAAYVLSLAQLALPPATALTTTGVPSTETGALTEGAPRRYALPPGSAGVEATLTTGAAALTGGLVLVVGDAVVAVATEQKPPGTPARVTVPAGAPDATPIVIVEAALSTTTTPVTFELALTPGGT